MLLDLARTRSHPGERSACPCCYGLLIAKCGSINIWHWAHESLTDCDHWSEGISEWHLAWQLLVKESCREVVIGEHRADIRLRTGQIIELQHSSISADEVEERELFYERMIWIFDADEFKHNLMLREKISKYGKLYYTFHWKRPRKSILACQIFPLYFDLGIQGVLQVKKFMGHEGTGAWGGYTSWGGWGYLLKKDFYLYNHLFGLDYEPSGSALLQPAP